MKKAITFLGCMAVPLLLGALGSKATLPNIETWYVTLNRPVFSPPNWLFAPVWTVLYLLIGVSFFMVITKKTTANKKPAVFFAVIQMILNTVWSFLFFQHHLLGWALLDIVLLLLCIVGMICAYFPVHKKAALLQVPYLVWVSFATVLNAAYFYLNA